MDFGFGRSIKAVVVQLFFALFYLCAVLMPKNSFAEQFMTITGKVSEAASKAGIKGVQVALMSRMRGKVTDATTDVRGNFILKNVREGNYDLLVTSDEDQFVMSSTDVIPIAVKAGKNVEGVAIKLQSGGAIKGRVITDKGVPIPQVTIMASGGSHASTDKTGHFLLKGVIPGDVQISIIPAAVGVKTISVVSKKNRVVDIGNVVLSVGSETVLRGTVTDTSGKLVEGAIIVVHKNRIKGGYTLSGKNGAFIIGGLSAGKYDLSVTALGYTPLNLKDIDAPAKGFKMVLSPSQGAKPKK